MISSNDRSQIPVIDISYWLSHPIHTTNVSASSPHREIVKQWHYAFSTLGFAIIVGHDVPHTLIETIKEESHEFFDVPLDIKLRFQHGPYGCSEGGYTPAGEEAVARSNTLTDEMLTDLMVQAADLHDTATFKSQVHARAPDPIENLVFQESSDRVFPLPSAEDYCQAMNKLLQHLHQISSAALGLSDINYFNDYFYQSHISSNSEPQVETVNDDSTVNMKTNTNALKFSHYFSSSPNTLPNGDSILYGEHTDYQGFTILLPDRNDWQPERNTKGLQVLHPLLKEWIPVSYQQENQIDSHSTFNYEDFFVINCGDLMQRWTNDRWVSAVHRVIGSSSVSSESAPDSRYSIVFFTGPHPDALIESIEAAGIDQDPEVGEELALLREVRQRGHEPYEPIVSKEQLRLKLSKGVMYEQS